MRLDSLTVQRYGALDGLELDDLAASPVVVVLGPNESGKSTLRDLVTSLLFGFDPASGSRHPLVRRGLDLAVHARFLDADGGSVEVQRTLGASTARGQVVRGGSSSALRNEPLTLLAHLPRAVYVGLASVEAADLRSLADTGGWKLAQERLLGGAHAEGLIPASVAVASLRQRREALWRPDRRSTKVVVRRLEAELKEARARVRSAAAERRETGRLECEGEALAERINALRGEYERAHRLAHILYPVAVGVGRFEARRRAADVLCNGRESLLGPHPAAVLEASRTAVSQAAERRDSAARALAEARLDADPSPEAARDASLAPVLEQVEQALEDACRADREAETAASELRQAASRRDEAAQLVVDHPAEERVLAAFGRLDPQGLVEARRDAALNEPAIVEQRNPPVASLFAAGTALLLAVVLALVGAPVPLVAVLAAVGLVALGAVVLFGRTRRDEPDETSRRTSGASERLLAAVAGAPVSPARLARPDSDLFDEVLLLRARQRELEQVRATGAATAAAARDARIAAQALLRPTEASSRDELRRRVESGRVAVEAARSQARRLPERAQAERAARDRSAASAAELARVEQILASLSPTGSVEDGLGRALEALELRTQAGAEERSARERFPALDDLAGEAERARDAGDLPVDGAAAAALGRHALELTDQRTEIAAEHARLGARLQTILEGPGIADAAGAVRALEAEIAEVRRDHDRLALAEAIVRAADVRLRRSRRPGFLIRASELIAAITGGAIVELDVSDPPAGRPAGSELVMRRHDSTTFETVGHPVSLGTLQQIHLAIRLALLDELDPLRLPLLLDEALVHWDGDRLGGFLQLLRAVDDRQVIVTTCHPWLAEAIEAECAARIVRLPASVAMIA